MLYEKYILFKIFLFSIYINGSIQQSILIDGKCSTSDTLQSPINIDTSKAIPINFPPFQFKHFNASLDTYTIINNGFTIEVSAQGTDLAEISGGPLKDHYRFHRGYLRWGENDTVGSEHTINNKRYPLEHHFEFYNTKYGSYENADKYGGNGDGSIIVTVFYEISSNDNVKFNRYLNMLASIRQPQANVKVSNPDSFAAFIPPFNKYFIYIGSLTVPPYKNLTKWIIIKDTINISSRQLAIFRTLLGDNGKIITYNYRDIQPHNARYVFTNSNGNEVSPGMF